MNVFDVLREKLEKLENEEKEEYFRKEALGLIDFAIKHTHGQYCYVNAKHIVNQVEQEYNNGWIPCSERLPEDKQRCLTTERIYFVPDHVDETDNYIGIQLNTYFKNFGWSNGDEVIAWQPLPKPYEVVN